MDREGEEGGRVFVVDEIALAEEEKAAADEATARREEEEKLRRRNELEQQMEAAAADLERRMEAVLVADEIALAEEEKADAADAGALRCG